MGGDICFLWKHRSCYVEKFSTWLQNNVWKFEIIKYYIETVVIIFIPRHMIVAGYYDIMLAAPVSICPFVHLYCFWTITWVNVSGFSPKSVCALIFWRSGLELLMGKFQQFLTELSSRDTSIFSFQDDNFSKCQWIFTKRCVHWYCGDLVWDC